MIIIVDFGSQTAHLIGRRLRQFGVAAMIVNAEEALLKIDELKPKGIIFSGGPASVNAKNAPTIDVKIFDLGLPILGICYGWQLMAKLMGGSVVSEKMEYGPERVTFVENSIVPAHSSCLVIMSHGDCVKLLPPSFKVIGFTKNVMHAAVVNPSKQFYGLQFHPEVYDTECGQEILKHFAIDICSCIPSPDHFSIEKILLDIKSIVKDAKVLCAVSGGLDSSVAGTLIERSIGENFLPIYIENGLMHPETESIVRSIFKNVVVIDAKKMFLEALKGIVDPEEKRKMIGKLYIDLFQKEALLYSDVKFLGQGTIYSDVIESKGTQLASHIKSHHNVGGLPKTLSLALLEPLRNFYKDEVKEIGRLLNLPEKILEQHPFPGPGYAVRILGEVTQLRLHQVKQADVILTQELIKAGLYDQLFQCFPVMTGAFSTAVKGDEGIFAEVIAIRAIESQDVMTAKWARLPYDVLQGISSRIVNEVPAISRVVYDISTKPPATMEWE